MQENMLLGSQLRVRADPSGFPNLASCVDMGERSCVWQRYPCHPQCMSAALRRIISLTSRGMAVCGGSLSVAVAWGGRSCNKTPCVWALQNRQSFPSLSPFGPLIGP
jgi:hypothetical protein